MRETQNGLLDAWYALGTFIGSHLMVIVPAGVALGVLAPQVLLPVKPFVPLLFALMTFQNSLSNDLRSMAKALKQPWALLAILVVVHLAMPLAAFLVASLIFGWGNQTVVGVLLEYCVPIGASTVMWIGMFSGEVALGLSALLISTVLSPFTIPMTLQLLVGTTVQVDTMGMMSDMAFMVAVPALLATALNELSGGWAKRELAPPTTPISRVILPLIVATNATGISGFLHDLTPRLVGIMVFMLACSIASFVVGLYVARRVSSTTDRFVAVSFSCGIRNVSAGAVLATQFFGPEVVFPAVIGTLFQQFLAALFGRIMERLISSGFATPRES